MMTGPFVLPTGLIWSSILRRMKKRHKVNIRQVCASIRLDLIKKFGIEVPNEDVTIIWKGGDYREISIHVLTGQVGGSVKEQFYIIGEI